MDEDRLAGPEPAAVDQVGPDRKRFSGNAADFYREAPWMILFPGAAISLAVFAFNLFGDSLRDYLDPRFKT